MIRNTASAPQPRNSDGGGGKERNLMPDDSNREQMAEWNRKLKDPEFLKEVKKALAYRSEHTFNDLYRNRFLTPDIEGKKQGQD